MLLQVQFSVLSGLIGPQSLFSIAPFFSPTLFKEDVMKKWPVLPAVDLAVSFLKVPYSIPVEDNACLNPLSPGPICC